MAPIVTTFSSKASTPLDIPTNHHIVNLNCKTYLIIWFFIIQSSCTIFLKHLGSWALNMAASFHSDSEEERALRPSDDEVLREEEDAERLLQTPQSSLGSLSPWKKRDPNGPRTLSIPPQDQRKQRRQKRKMKRRRRGDAEGASLMYEMDDQTAASDELESSSEDEHARRPDPRKASSPAIESPSDIDQQQVRRRKLVNFILIPLVLMGIFASFMFGSYKLSEGRDSLTGLAQLRSNGTHSFGPTTILISLDGFRADFLNRNITPTLNSFIAEGISPKYMLPSFPSVTFPNHWTLVTGLYPESHGVVGNSFWDPDLEEEFYYTDPKRSMQPEWWTSTGAEPLWSTCERAGVRSAVHMWPGSEAGVEPDAATVDKFNGNELLSKKVGRVLSFLDRPSAHDKPSVAAADARPQLVAMYVPNVDSDGHKYGPNSTEIRETIRNVDDMLALMLKGLHVRNLTDVVNVVVVSDHGMATTSTSRLIQLDDLLDPALIEHTDGWPLYGLRPRPDVSLLDLYTRLLGRAREPDAHFQVYLRTDMPERWHFRHSERIAPLWIIPDAGWAIVPRSEFDVASAQRSGDPYHPRGLHGYDHEHPLMRAIFVARGPAFPHVPGSRLDVFQNIEVYNIVCDSLGVEPRPNNGTLRLPLQPVGAHGDDGDTSDLDEDVVDLPERPAEVSGPDVERPSPTPEEGSEKDINTEIEDDNDDERSGLRKFWGSLVDKFNDATEWVKGVFNGSSGNEEPDRL